MKEGLRSFRSLNDSNENRGQLFALTRVLPNARPFGLPVYVAPLPAGFILVAEVRAFRSGRLLIPRAIPASRSFPQ